MLVPVDICPVQVSGGRPLATGDLAIDGGWDIADIIRGVGVGQFSVRLREELATFDPILEVTFDKASLFCEARP